MTGPGKDDSYADKRDDYQKNEVAVDYNSGFTGARSTSENNGHMITHTSFGVFVESSTADLDHTINRHNMHCYTNEICRHANTASCCAMACPGVFVIVHVLPPVHGSPISGLLALM